MLNGIGDEVEGAIRKMQPEIDGLKEAFESEISKTVDGIRSGLKDFIN